MKLAFGEIERLLMHLHGVPEERRTAMRSRIQHLQRNGIPSTAPTGRGGRLEYDVDAVFQLVTAFELAGLGWPAQALVGFILQNWKALRPLVDAGFEARDIIAAEATTDYAVIHPDALAAIAARPAMPLLEIASGELIASWALRGVRPTVSSHIVIDLVDIARRSARFLHDVQ
jgi:hypothetical protein